MTGWLVGVPVTTDNEQPESQRKAEPSQGDKTDWPTSSVLVANVA